MQKSCLNLVIPIESHLPQIICFNWNHLSPSCHWKLKVLLSHYSLAFLKMLGDHCLSNWQNAMYKVSKWPLKNVHNVPASKIYNNMQICLVLYCRNKSVIINVQLCHLCFKIQFITNSVGGYYTISRVEAHHELR